MKYYLLTVFTFLMILGTSCTSKTDSPPNIVVILADDLGYSDLGCYGGEIRTPNINSLAEKGLRFTQFYNDARCWPTRASIMTGYYAQQVNVDGKRGDFPAWGNLLPHHLKQAGYRCYHSGKWHVTNVKKMISDAGFDRSYYTRSWDNHFSANRHLLNDQELPVVNEGNGYYSTTAITDYAVEFLEEHEQEYPESPFFLYLAYISPHFPLQAPEEDIARYKDRYMDGWEKLKKERYERQKSLGFDLGENSPFEYEVTAPWSWAEEDLKDTIPGELRLAKPWAELSTEEKTHHAAKMSVHAAMVDRVDQEVGRVLNQLQRMGIDNNTLVLFLSDNGASAEQIVRGNGHKPDSPAGSADSYLCLGPGFSTACNTPFRRHKHWTHEGGAATPLIVCWPEGIKDKGGFRHTMGHIIDFVPTFCELAEVDPLSGNNGNPAPDLPGKSLVKVFQEDFPVHKELFFSHAGNKALRQGKWKAVISTKFDSTWQLYNMEEDRTELNNLAAGSLNDTNSNNSELMQNKLEEMKARWEELNQLYLTQGDQ